jgi:dCMP deaminase
MQSAREAASNSNCIRRAVGAVVIKNGEIIAAGWNGVGDAYKNCGDAGCPRCLDGGSTGTGYEFCICIHAEQMAIGNAAARGVATDGSTVYVNLRPCLPCLALMRAAGVRRVYFDEEWSYPERFESIYKQQAGEFDFFGRIPLDEAFVSPIRRIA